MKKYSRISDFKSLIKKLAVPISSDYIENIFSEPFRSTVPSTRELLVYHGTCTKKLEDIISHGSLDPTKSAEGKSWPETSPGIYVTTKLGGFSSSAELYAHKASRVHGGEPIMLELSIPLGWIEVDPDDTRKNEETQEINEAGKVQGRILQPVPVSRITKVIEPEIGSKRMEAYTFHDYIQKLLKEKSTGRKYKKTLKEQLPTAVKTDPVMDIENTIAESLTSWHNNIFSPYETGTNGLTVFDNALIFAFTHKDKKAIESLKEFCQVMGDDISEMEVYPDEYKPKSYETLKMFLKRYERST